MWLHSWEHGFLEVSSDGNIIASTLESNAATEEVHAEV